MEVRKMKRLTVATLCLLVMFTGFAFGTKSVPLPDVLKPLLIEVGGDDLVIAEGAEISIYSLKDFTLIKKFGKAGEGPAEFKLTLGILGLDLKLYPDYILVNSLNKISYFTRKGEFIKEKPIGTRSMFEFRDKAIGTSMAASGKLYRYFNFYNGKGEKIKEICSQVEPVIRGNGAALLDLLGQVSPRMQMSENRIFIGGKQALEIEIYDENGNFLKAIKRDVEKRAVTGDEKTQFIEAYKVHTLYRTFWERIKPGIKSPDFFPAYKTFFVSGQTVYVQTFTQKEGKTRFLVFDEDGKYLKTYFLPLAYENILTPYLYTIDSGKLYQLVENEDQWELRITAIE